MLHRRLLLTLQDTAELPRILRTLTLYCCRLVDSMAVRALQRDPLCVADRQEIREIKAWLDSSEYRNDLYRCLWTLAQTRYWRREVTPVSMHYSMDRDEVERCFCSLQLSERDAIKERPYPDRFDSTESERIMKKLAAPVRGQAWRRMRFVFMNDAGHSQQDAEQDLREDVASTIRHYEVFGVEPKDMIKLAGRSISNRARNMARYAGNKDRNPLLTLQDEDPYRIVWYLDTEKDRIVRACVYCDATRRQQKGDFVHTRLQTGEAGWVNVYQLWDNEKEASAALVAWRNGASALRAHAIDLSPRRDRDWQPVLSSASRQIPDMQATFLDMLSNEPEQEDRCFCSELEAMFGKSPIQRVVDIIVNGGDPFFEEFCRGYDEDPATLSLPRLGTMARRYCNLSTREIATQLSHLPAETWTPRMRRILREKRNEKDPDLASGY